MKLGNNIGEILLEIAQTNISKGEPEKAFSLYKDCFQGFEDKHVRMLLKNEAVIEVINDGVEINLSTDPDLIEKNKENIFDWNLIVISRLEDIQALRESRIKCIENFRNGYSYNKDIEDYNIFDMMLKYLSREEIGNLGHHNIAAKLIAGDSFDGDKYSSGENTWENLCTSVEEGGACGWEKILYFTVKYVSIMKSLHKSYINFANMYKFLEKENIISHYPFIEWHMEHLLEILYNFSDDSKGYYHPMCNTKLYDYKNNLLNDICLTEWGSDYCKYKILKKDILDGYDAGWLSPEGDFYGENGDVGNMIHLVIADTLSLHTVSIGDSKNSDYALERLGWIKIHHQDIYGVFTGTLDEKPDSDGVILKYCPSKIQIKMICEYADKFYNGSFYTEASIFGKRLKQTIPYKTRDIRQMDDIMLHTAFSF